MRKSAKLMLQFIPGTDFICSGYSAVPKRDNLFGGGNFDAEDFDDWNVLQRDMQVDGGVLPVTEDEVLAIRRKAAEAIQAVYAELGFPADHRRRRWKRRRPRTAATTCRSATSSPTWPRPIASWRAIRACWPWPTRCAAAASRRSRRNILEMGRQRLAGDYLCSRPAIFARRTSFHVLSAINDPNDYAGPGTGYRLEGERWAKLQAIRQAQSPRDFIAPNVGAASPKLVEIGPARPSTRPEVIVAVGPGFNAALTRTIGGLEHEEVLAAILSGVADEGLTARVVKVYRSSDLAAIGYAGAELSGSGIAIGLQSRGTTVIHKRGLARLNNLELFPQSPSLTLETYRAIGRNAARYAKGIPPVPVGVKIDNWARLRLIVKTALLHRRETDEIADKPPQELWFDWEPD